MHFGAIALCGVTAVAGLLYLRKCSTGPFDLQCDQLTPLERLAAFLAQAKVRATKRLRPKRIILIRHGESEGNVDHSAYSNKPDHMIPLTARGRSQALVVGAKLRRIAEDGRVLFLVSPYRRTQETLFGILRGGNWSIPSNFFEELGSIDASLFEAEAAATPPSLSVDVRIDPRVREQEWGTIDSMEDMEKIVAQRERVGRFFFRFPNGESGADVYDRASSFLTSLYRQMDNVHTVKYDTIVIVAHGLFNRLFLMRYFRWSVPCFESIENFKNCEMCVLHKSKSGHYELATSLRLKDGKMVRPSHTEPLYSREVE